MKALLALFLKITTLFLITTLYLYLSVKDLYVDVINPDGINWHNRTETFSRALADGRYEETYQAYHPGTTLMWISGPLVNLVKLPKLVNVSVSDPKTTFLERDCVAKLSVVIFCTAVLIITIVTLWKLGGFKYAASFALLMSLEPFVIGMRRLYHLDYLMTVLLFLCFLLLAYYNYRSPRWFLLPLAALFFVLAILTKSLAIILLPVIPVMFVLGNAKILKKLAGLLIFLFSTTLFVYTLFPPVWKDPIRTVPRYFNKIAFGVSNIGVEGRKEIGTSGKGDSVTMDETLEDRGPNFYIESLFMRLSPPAIGLLIISTAFYIHIFLKGTLLTIRNIIKSRRFPGTFNYAGSSWVSILSLGFSSATIFALSMSAKKSDRYEIIVFPFLLIIVAYFLSKLRYYLIILVIALYVILVALELKSIHPYYLAYSNPYLGGIEVRLNVLDGSPFGIGTYAAFDLVKNDLEKDGNSGYYTISGSKSIKAISAGGRFSRTPSCITDYSVVYAFKDKPTYSCVNRYVLVDTVKVGGFDYWYVYKRLNQKHESDYD